MGTFGGGQKNQRFIHKIINPSNWVKTKKLNQQVWVALPDVGTVFRDNLNMENKVTTPRNPFVVYGILGEIQIIQEKELCDNFRYLNNRVITSKSLDNKQVNGKIDWFQVESVSDNTYWALIVSPRKYGANTIGMKIGLGGQERIVNRAGIPHGCGDVLICNDFNGTPNLQTLRIENGLKFLVAYDLSNIGKEIREKCIERNLSRHRVVNNPRYKFIRSVDRHIEDSASMYKEFESKFKQLVDQLGNTYYRVEYETDGYSSLTAVIESITGKAIGFSIQFDGIDKTHAKLKLFESQQGNISNTFNVDGAVQIDKFIQHLEQKIKY